LECKGARIGGDLNFQRGEGMDVYTHPITHMYMETGEPVDRIRVFGGVVGVLVRRMEWTLVAPPFSCEMRRREDKGGKTFEYLNLTVISVVWRESCCVSLFV
jgi:hypothetical protein